MPDEQARPTTWATRRKAAIRQMRLNHREEDPRYPGAGILYSTLDACPHGTQRGYDDYGCRCIDRGPPVPATPDDPTSEPVPSGCRPVGVTASATRRKTRRNATAVTVPLRPITSDPASALTQLDNRSTFHQITAPR